MNYCTHCGTSLEGAVNFCKNCGHRLLKAQTSLSELADRRDTSVKDGLISKLKAVLSAHKKLAIGIGTGVAVVVLVLVLVLAVFRNVPQPVVEQPLTVAELLDLGSKYLLELDYEQALVQFELVIEIEPMNMLAHLGIAEAHIGLGDIDNALTVLLGGFEKFSKDKEFLTSSIALYEKIIEAEPLIAEVYIRLAETHMALEDKEAAIAVLRRGLEVLPDNTLLSEMLASLLPVGGKHTIAVGFSHCLAIKNDGSLWAWGMYSLLRDDGTRIGALCDGTIRDEQLPFKVMGNVSSVAAGDGYCFAVTTEGSLWAWGFNDRGQIGDGTITERVTPVCVFIIPAFKCRNNNLRKMWLRRY